MAEAEAGERSGGTHALTDTSRRSRGQWAGVSYTSAGDSAQRNLQNFPDHGTSLLDQSVTGKTWIDNGENSEELRAVG
jgi:hypothetical protein